MSKYIVNARIPEGADQDTLVANFARAFNVSEAKARGRLGKLPGRVSKPVTDREARYLAKRFDKIGLQTDIVEAASTAAQTGDTPHPDMPTNAFAKDVRDTDERDPDSTDAAARMLRDTEDREAQNPDAQNPDAQNRAESQRPAKVDREAATQAFAASVAATVDTSTPASTPASVSTFEDPAFSLNPGAVSMPPTAPGVVPFTESGDEVTADGVSKATKTTKKTKTKKPQTMSPLQVRFGVRKKLLLSALAPLLLMLLISLLTVAVRVPPLLQHQQETTSEAVATTLATSIAALIVNPLENPDTQPLLQQWLGRTQVPLLNQNIDAVLVSNMRGQILAGWLGDTTEASTNLSNLPLTVQATVQAEVARASARFAAEQSGVVLGQRALPAPIIRVGERELVLTARVITQTQNGTPTLTGAVIIGSDVQPNQQATRNMLIIVTLLALLPLALAVGLALWFGLRMRQVVRGVLVGQNPRFADGHPTLADSHDELGLLARTLRNRSGQARP